MPGIWAVTSGQLNTTTLAPVAAKVDSTAVEAIEHGVDVAVALPDVDAARAEAQQVGTHFEGGGQLCGDNRVEPAPAYSEIGVLKTVG